MLKLPCEMFAQEPPDIRSSNGGLKELVRNRESLPIFVDIVPLHVVSEKVVWQLVQPYPHGELTANQPDELSTLLLPLPLYPWRGHHEVCPPSRNCLRGTRIHTSRSLDLWSAAGTLSTAPNTRSGR
jgi:hypothetical protein